MNYGFFTIHFNVITNGMVIIYNAVIEQLPTHMIK